MTRVASIGECMIELAETADGTLRRGYGGDTLNTAVYLARLGVAVDYVTVLGTDPWSEEMLAEWRGEGVGTSLVPRRADKLPGLYFIKTDGEGERRFYYWRELSAARLLFELPETPKLARDLASYDVLYLSGITLSLYGEAGRARLLATLATARAKGCRIAFDTNFRPRGWPDPALAKRAYRSLFDTADIVLASVEDLELLFGADGECELPTQRQTAEIVLKLQEPAVRVLYKGLDELIRAEPVAGVVDTTAAGDSFAAAYLAARLAGADPLTAARSGHRLAGAVVQYRGAIIPRASMPSGILPASSPAPEPRP